MKLNILLLFLAVTAFTATCVRGKDYYLNNSTLDDQAELDNTIELVEEEETFLRKKHQQQVSGQINYFGVAFSPYVKNRTPDGKIPFFNSYTLDDIKQLLKIALTRHNAISTYGMGVADYNKEKPFDQCDSNCLIARAAAQINKDRKSVVLSVSQGIFQHENDLLQKREVDNAFSAALDANSIHDGTVWGLTFTNEYITNQQNGPKIIKLITDNLDRARKNKLKVGTRIRGDICQEVIRGSTEHILKKLAKISDFIMCNFYPSNGSGDPDQAVVEIAKVYFEVRTALTRENPNLEVIIGETGWPSAGDSFNNKAVNNNVKNMVLFWNGMQKWSNSNRVKIQMFEAFDESFKNMFPAETHYGWWYRPDNDRAVYIEKASGKTFQ